MLHRPCANGIRSLLLLVSEHKVSGNIEGLWPSPASATLTQAEDLSAPPVTASVIFSACPILARLGQSHTSPPYFSASGLLRSMNLATAARGEFGPSGSSGLAPVAQHALISLASTAFVSFSASAATGSLCWFATVLKLPGLSPSGRQAFGSSQYPAWRSAATAASVLSALISSRHRCSAC